MLAKLEIVLTILDEIVAANKLKGNDEVMYLTSLIPTTIDCMNGFLQANSRNYRLRMFDAIKLKIEIY